MKRLGFALALGVAAVISTTSARAQDAIGPYVALGLGLHSAAATNLDYEEPPGTKTGQSNANFRLGFNIAAAAGYRWSDYMRFEAELGYRSAGLDNIGPLDAEGKQSAFSIMGNILFDVGEGTNFQPYIGGGVGLANNSWSNVEVTTSPIYDDNNKKMQWQAIVGLELPLNPQTKWFVDYRYIGSVDNDFNTIPARARVVGVDLTSHNLMVGVRHSF
jgi:opacity protein-like surface antigen